MKSKLTKLLSLCFCVLTCDVAGVQADSVPKLINYQGRLTDAGNNPLPNGTYCVAFSVWSTKASTGAGDQLIWGQEYNVTVANGIFNVILGAPGGTPISGAAVNDLGYAFGDSSRFIGLTVTHGTNGAAIPGSTEILPRQQILSSPFALNAANGCPVGGVIMWWGNVGSIPENFELCDGQAPSSPGAVLAGLKPDLRDRFPKGATTGRTNVEASPVSGGTNSIGARVTGGTALTIAQMPAHGHGVTDPGHSHVMWAINTQGDRGSGNGGIPRSTTPRSPVNLNTSHSTTGVLIQDTGGGAQHEHTMPAHDNRPAFLEMFFIIRVK